MKNMGDGRRVARVEREVQTAIAQFLLRGFKSPLPGLVTVTSVKMPADLRSARVYVSVLGPDDPTKETVELLQERAFEVQNFIGRELTMRYCPKLTFYADSSTKQILKVEKILHDLELERKKSEPKNHKETDDDN